MKKILFSLSTLAALVMVFVGISVWNDGRPTAYDTAIAQDASSPFPQRYITVVGEGTVNIKPDIAKTTIGVETVKASVKEASSENREILTQVIDALKAAGIAEKDMQTAGFNIYAEQLSQSESNPQDSPQVRYHVINQVLVTIRNTERVGELLDIAIEAGANSSYGVEFRLDDQEAARSQARSRAVENARMKAEELATLTGTSVDEVLSVSEVIGSSPFYSSPTAMAFGGLGGGAGTPITAGELQLTMQVQVTYATR